METPEQEQPLIEKRFADFASLSREEETFVLRQLEPRSARLVLLAVVAFVAILVISLKQDDFSLPMIVAAVCCVFLVLIAGISLFMDKVYRSVLINEFQNALFADAIRAGTEFCLIVRKNHEIIYCNPGFLRNFMKHSLKTLTRLEQVLEHFSLSAAGQES
ncbi:MAG: hypothetical protein KDD76_04675, partial [Rickettsiales bacterium]|nr:hypothetical protein [Rickettsiales bacterium]